MRVLFLGRKGNEPVAADTTSDLDEALRRLDESEYDVVVVDLAADGGEDPVPAIAAAAPRTAIVVLTGAADEDEGLRAIRAGAQDALARGEADGDALVRRMRYSIERKKREQVLARHAHYDPLTDLANRALFRERLSQALARADRTGRVVAVLWLDLDGFKQATEGWSREESDELIRQAGVRLHRSVRQVDTVGRPGGDEFTILLEGLSRPEEAEIVARKITMAMTEPLLREPPVTLSASTGIAWYPDSGKDEILQHASDAMRDAKRTARGSFRLRG